MFKPFLSSPPLIIKERENLEKRRILTESIKKTLVKKNGKYYLPKGVILYHGTLDKEFGMDIEFAEGIPMIYFGLDVEISLWFILEASYSRDHMDTDIKRSIERYKNYHNTDEYKEELQDYEESLNRHKKTMEHVQKLIKKPFYKSKPKKTRR